MGKKTKTRTFLEWVLGWIACFLVIYGILSVMGYYQYLVSNQIPKDFDLLAPVASAIVASCIILAVLTDRLFSMTWIDLGDSNSNK